jgi:Putative papain-like cysteine peptidase (DUF1796)
MEIFARSRIRRLVGDLYRAILGREPDPDGARAYESLIRKLGPERAVPKMLKAFLRSAEYRERADALAVSYIKTTLASQGDQLVNGSPVGHLVSLGSFCLPSLLFRDNGLRKYSLPFDWIFSSPQMVRDCLADDFAVFLDRRHYQSVSHLRTEPGAEHELYRERYGVPELFAHRDPTQEADYLYFVRCVERFRQLLRSEDAKLFLIIGRAHHDLTNEFPLLLEALTSATTNFVLLCIELLDPTEPGVSAIVPVARNGNHALYRFTPSSYNAEGGFLPDKLDEWTLLRLVYRYKLTLKDSPGTGGGPRGPAHLSPEESRDSEEPEHAFP